MNDIRKGHVLFHFSDFSKTFIKNIIFSLMNTAELCQLCQGKRLLSNFVVEEWLVTIFLLLLSRLMTTSEKDSSIWPRVAHKAYFLVFKKKFPRRRKILYIYICSGGWEYNIIKERKKKDIGAWEEAIGLHCSNSFQLDPVLGSLARSV